MIYTFPRQELKNKTASDFKHGDVIVCSKYNINIRYKNKSVKYKTPSLLSTVENKRTFKTLDCTPGIGTPYFIVDFLSR